jgi:ketosteroid isomerase-like protein
VSDTVDTLILDLLEWMGPSPRPYAEVLQAWGTSCPRLPVWEDATDRGFIVRHRPPGHGAVVSVSAAGSEYLRKHRRPSQDNVELVREGYARWQAGDYDLLLDFFLANAAPDVELYSRLGGLSGAPYRGHDGVRSWLAEIQETFERFEPWVDDAREAGEDRVVAIGGIRFRARESGVDMAERLGWVYEFRNGQLCRMMFYGSPGEALKAVGLPESTNSRNRGSR